MKCPVVGSWSPLRVGIGAAPTSASSGGALPNGAWNQYESTN
jgi:hypothetical protein